MSIALASHGKTCRYESVDRISNLPSEIIHQLLHLLPIKDAVKTSALCRGWRYKWTHMPDLMFHNHSITYSNFTNFINKFLLLHHGVISKFHLIIYGGEYTSSDVDQWILFLSRKHLTHLALRFEDPVYQMPSCLLSYQSLKVLKLEYCSLQIPSEFQVLASLTYLKLRTSKISDQTLERLLFMTPLLQTLKIYCCEPLVHYNIHGPNLQRVYICALPPCESISFRNTPNVRDASFTLWLPKTGLSYKLDDLLGGFYALQTIRICYRFIEFLPLDITPRRLEMIYYDLTHVNIEACFKKSTQLQAILCLCRSAPNLKFLKVKADWDNVLPEENFWDARMHREVGVFHHLETVRLKQFIGTKNDTGFTQFILLNAVVLDTFCIIWENHIGADSRLQVVEGMMQYPRASSNAKVVFKAKTKF